MRIGLPNPSNTPCIVDLHLPITEPGKATEILNELFAGKSSQLDRLWDQKKISPIVYRVMTRDMIQCQQRVQRLMQVINGPPPRWTEQDSTELEALLSIGRLDTILEEESEETPQQQPRHSSPTPSAQEKEVVPTGESSSGWEDLTSSNDEQVSGLQGISRAQIMCVRDVHVTRETRNRRYEVLPPPISLRNLSPLPLSGETTTTITGPITPIERLTAGERPSLHDEWDAESASRQPSKFMNYWGPSIGLRDYGI